MSMQHNPCIAHLPPDRSFEAWWGGWAALVKARSNEKLPLIWSLCSHKVQLAGAEPNQPPPKHQMFMGVPPS